MKRTAAFTGMAIMSAALMVGAAAPAARAEVSLAAASTAVAAKDPGVARITVVGEDLMDAKQKTIVRKWMKRSESRKDDVYFFVLVNPKSARGTNQIQFEVWDTLKRAGFKNVLMRTNPGVPQHTVELTYEH